MNTHSVFLLFILRGVMDTQGNEMTFCTILNSITGCYVHHSTRAKYVLLLYDFAFNHRETRPRA